MRCSIRLDELLAPVRDDPSEAAHAKLDMRAVLDEIQTLVTFAAALARYFWPAQKPYKARGAYLRDKFGLDDTSPLANKELRNALEHYDERLDDYLKVGMFGFMIVDYVGLAPGQDEVPAHIMRAYYTDTTRFVVLNKEFEIRELHDEVLRLYVRLKEMDRNGAVFR